MIILLKYVVSEIDDSKKTFCDVITSTYRLAKPLSICIDELNTDDPIIEMYYLHPYQAFHNVFFPTYLVDDGDVLHRAGVFLAQLDIRTMHCTIYI